MNEFFTPIQVPSQEKPAFEPYELSKYNEDPFQMAFSRIESLGDSKRKIIQWLKEMPLPQRMQQLTYTNKQFTSLLMNMIERNQLRPEPPIEFSICQMPSRGYLLQHKANVHSSETLIWQAEQELFGCLRIMNKFSLFDTIAINAELAENVNHLFHLFETIENGIYHELTKDNMGDYESEHSHLLFHNPLEHDYPFKSAGSWVVQVLKKSLSFKYLRSQHQQKEKKEAVQVLFDVKEKNKKVQRYWKHLCKLQRAELIASAFSADIRHLLHDYRETIHVDDSSFPKIKYASQTQIQRFRRTLIDDNGQQIYHLLAFTCVSEIDSIAMHKYELLTEIEGYLHREEIKEDILMKKKKPVVKQKSKKKEVPGPLEGISLKKKVSEAGQKSKEKGGEQKERKQNDGSKRVEKANEQKDSQLQKEKDFENSTDKKIGKKEKDQKTSQQENMANRKQKIKKKKKKEQRKKQIFQYQSFSQTSQTTVEPQNSDEDSHSENSINFLHQRNQQLQTVYKKIEQKCRIGDKQRKVAINRVASILEQLHLSFQVYGSYACDLTIPKSDVDICVDPTIVNFFYTSFCSYRDKIIMSLDFLKNAFEKYLWVKNFKLISTATVPVLTFEINLNTPFSEQLAKDKNLNIPKLHTKTNQVNVVVDFTIEPFANLVSEIVPHLGQQSTQLVKEWVNQYSHFQAVVKIYKLLLEKQNLNKSYTGGLSSFALILLVGSFFQITERTGNLCETLLDFNRFLLGLKSTSIIDLRKKEIVCEENKTGSLMVINPLNGKNLLESCYRWKEVTRITEATMERLGKQEPLTESEFF